jgi:type IV pilus assembly protein PilV
MDKTAKSIYRPICDRGFTLIEILIAIFILVTALLGLISTTVIVIKSNSLSKAMTTATTLAKDKMEQLKNTGYGSSTSPAINVSETIESIYTRTWTVTANGSPAAGMKTIVVTVQWNWQSAPHNVSLTTIVAR